MNKTIVIDRRKCSACGDCLAFCPQNVLEIQEFSKAEKESMSFFQRMDAIWHKNKRLTVINPERCLGCRLCFKACTHDALFFKETYNTKELSPV